jgi:hypothetical protein
MPSTGWWHKIGTNFFRSDLDLRCRSASQSISTHGYDSNFAVIVDDISRREIDLVSDYPGTPYCREELGKVLSPA